MRKAILVLAAAPALVAAPAWACGGLVAPNGAVQLVRTTTMAGYHDGVEHYVTSFAFDGAAGEFGSIVPLPGVPTRVQRGGEWTLQRLVQEVTPQPEFVATDAAVATVAQPNVTVIQRKKVGALDIAVLRGGGRAVAEWAEGNGFDLTPDAPRLLEFYARRSPVFMAARFDAARAEKRGLVSGDGTPIHLTIPTDDPWIPLRILSLGQPTGEAVRADLFLLTDQEPSILPPPRGSNDLGTKGLTLEREGQASRTLLADLRSDRGMGWLPPTGMWLTYLRLDSLPGDLTYDLAVDADGGRPSPVDAGLSSADQAAGRPVPLWVLGAVLAALVAVLVVERRTATAGR